MIRWKRGDYIKLGKAVSEFNKEIEKNKNVVDDLVLPEKIEYKELRDRIQTREGLNAYINSLKRIKLPGSFDVVSLENGEQITRYEKRELDSGRKSVMSSLSNQIAELEQQTKSNYGIDSDIKLPNAFKSQKQKELERKLRDYKKLYKLTGKDFKRRARELGINQTELQYRRSYIFRQNYMKVMREKYSDFENFDKFEKWARKHKNPVRFYEALPDGEFYPDDLQYQSDVVFTQENFNSFLESLGIQIEETIEEG